MKLSVKARYQGIQTTLGKAHEYACLFLSLLSIVEDYTKKPIDFITAYRTAVHKKYINEDFECLDQEAMLKEFTGKKWTRTVVEHLPDPVPDNMYTIEKWYNPRTKFTHFRRRGFDTLMSSVTVTEGKLINYYCYTVKE